jgi:hypothetical protein
MPLKEKRSHYRISPLDVIQIVNKFYLIDQVGTKKDKDHRLKPSLDIQMCS